MRNAFSTEEDRWNALLALDKEMLHGGVVLYLRYIAYLQRNQIQEGWEEFLMNPGRDLAVSMNDF